jgi:hypothetical protein
VHKCLTVAGRDLQISALGPERSNGPLWAALCARRQKRSDPACSNEEGEAPLRAVGGGLDANCMLLSNYAKQSRPWGVLRSRQNNVCCDSKQRLPTRLSIGLVVLVFLASPASTLGVGSGAESLEARFLTEAPAAWARYAERARELQGTCSFRFSQTYRGLKVWREEGLKKNQNAKLLSVVYEKSSGTEKTSRTMDVYGVNPNYAFKLRQNASGSWAITDLVDLRRPDPPSVLPNSFEEEFVEFERGLMELVRLHRETLLEVVKKPEFKIVRCRRVPDPRDDLVEVAFDYTHEVDERKGNPIQGGALVLDPRRDWCLRSYDVKVSRGTMKLRAQELNDTPSGISVPKRTLLENEFIFDDERGTNRQTFQCEYDLNAPSRLPDDREFTLSAFGLPEPKGAAWPTRSIPLYVWVALCGASLFLLGLALRKLQRRLVVDRANG